METAIDKGKRKRSIEVAKVLLLAGTQKELISTATQLSLEEIALIEKGEEIDKEEY